MSQLKVNAISDAAGANGNAITLATDGTCTAKVTNNLSNRNLITNGSCIVAQRATQKTTHTGHGYFTVDRIYTSIGGENEGRTEDQIALTASDTGPWEKGFRNSFQITNGNQTSVDNGDYQYLLYRVEAQDIATSGWDYTSSSSYITLSFWLKSSVAQTFYGYLRTDDGTKKYYSFNTGALSANTWTKITKTIPGASGIQINNDTGVGLDIVLYAYAGGDYTFSITEEAWASWNSGARTRTQTSTWWETDNATFAITGLQLEVGHATDFEHRSYADELARCQRYYEAIYMNAGTNGFQSATSYGGQVSNNIFAVTKRAKPTFSLEGNATWVGATPNVFTDPHNFIFHHGSTAYALSDGDQDLCGSFSAEL